MPRKRSLLDQLEARAKGEADGHFTIMRFTTNWRVALGTPDGRKDITRMAEGKTLAEAIRQCLGRPYPATYLMGLDDNELDQLDRDQA